MKRGDAFSLVLVVWLSACGSSGSGLFDEEGWASLRSPDRGQITYNAGYGGGTTNFVAPLTFVGDGVTDANVQSLFTTADPSVGVVDGVLSLSGLPISTALPVNAILIRSTGTGATTVTGNVNGQFYTANLNVIGFTPQDVALGNQRYNAPANPDGNLRQACSACHGQPDLMNHSTTFLADLTDSEIIRTAIQGIAVERRNVSNGEIQTYEPLGGQHVWGVTAEEAAGLVAYLRSRPPTVQLPRE